MRADSSDADAAPPDVLRVRDLPPGAADALLASHGLQLHFVDDAAPIPGSFWGEPEAGVIAHRVHARADTPVHSLLHEACHLIVAPVEKRATIHTDAIDIHVTREGEGEVLELSVALPEKAPPAEG